MATTYGDERIEIYSESGSYGPDTHTPYRDHLTRSTKQAIERKSHK